MSAATSQMFAIRSHTGASKRAAFVLHSSRRFICAAIVAVLFAACTLLTPAGPQRGNPAGRKNQPGRSAAADGRKMFESVCATCHGLDGRGSERGPNVATRAEVQQLSDAETLRILQAGIPAAGMPAFGALGVPNLQAVMAYLRILQGGSKAAFIPGDPQRGQSLFFGKAGCASCHMINGSGGFFGADLSSYGSNASIEEIRSAIADPDKNLDPRARTVLVTTRDGRQFTGIARNEDNFSLQLQSLDGAFHLFAKSDLEHLEYQPKSLMPSDYGSILSRGELDDLVSYLVRTAQATKLTQAPGTNSNSKPEKEDD
jgi:cytochrome c oxidase cbb3-type subunit 3